MEENNKKNIKKSIKEMQMVEDNPRRKGLLVALRGNEPKTIVQEYEVAVYETEKPSDK